VAFSVLQHKEFEGRDVGALQSNTWCLAGVERLLPASDAQAPLVAAGLQAGKFMLGPRCGKIVLGFRSTFRQITAFLSEPEKQNDGLPKVVVTAGGEPELVQPQGDVALCDVADKPRSLRGQTYQDDRANLLRASLTCVPSIPKAQPRSQEPFLR
jgi:hypothetical protein